MAILQTVLTLVFQQMGRILNTAFGWATKLLFGEVPQKRQNYLSVIALGSVLWLAVVIGIAFPNVGTFLLAFVPLREWVSGFWVRMLMLGLAILLPAVVGIVSIFLVEPSDRPEGVAAKVKAILKGYPYTVGLAVTLIVMLFIAPIVKVRNLLKGWTSAHVPIMVRAADYFDVLGDIQSALKRGGLETQQAPASRLVRWPTKLFTFFAGNSVADLVADQLTVLQSPKIEVLLHPSDLVIRGNEKDVTRAHALLTEHLTFTKAYLTWSKEAHDLEDQLSALWRKMRSHSAYPSNDGISTRLADFERDLSRVNLSYEEWEVLFREKLLVERDFHRESHLAQ